MNIRLEAAALIMAWAGATVLLGLTNRCGSLGLPARWRRYQRGQGAPAPWPSPDSRIGHWLAVEGVGRAALAEQLRQAGSSLSPTEFRAHQLRSAILSTMAAGAVAGVLRLPAFVGLAALLTPGPTAVLLSNGAMTARARRHRRQVQECLPTMAQMLTAQLCSGSSLSKALVHLAGSGQGPLKADLLHICSRISQGMGELAALSEWAGGMSSAGAIRLVETLRAATHSGDLARLVRMEGRNLSEEAHRRRLAIIERRAQQVWIPVAVATLVPGAVLLLVPFVSALTRLAQI